jgi:hypothetical protein
VADEGDTVAVNVTFCPHVDGFAPEDRVVVVPAWFTVCMRDVEVLLAWLLSPLKLAVME